MKISLFVLIALFSFVSATATCEFNISVPYYNQILGIENVCYSSSCLEDNLELYPHGCSLTFNVKVHSNNTVTPEVIVDCDTRSPGAPEGRCLKDTDCLVKNTRCLTEFPQLNGYYYCG